MKFGAVFWVDRTTWPSVRDAALAAEGAGFDSVWIDSHLMPVQGDWRDPKLEGWTTLAALGALTNRVTLGLMVNPTTFVNPAITIKRAVTLDAITGGRVILGVGAGYYVREHEAYGLPFGSTRERVDRMEEALEIMQRLLSGEVFNYDGHHFSMFKATVAPGPATGAMPVLIGGAAPRILRLAARFSDIWNGFGTFEQLQSLNTALDRACLDCGRDPGAIERSFMRNICVRASVDEANRDWAAIDANHGDQHTNTEWLQIGGSLHDVAEELKKYQTIGFDHVVMPFREPYDLETINAVPRLRELLEGSV
jgi:alkanesulfonate monooxygenase SsuD/methylene tetrahydromethanopterin reductase-like flavin-dependent oxidoreductase (luciferase family)